MIFYVYILQETYGYNDSDITGIFSSQADALKEIQESYDVTVVWRESGVSREGVILYHLWYAKADRRAEKTWPWLTRWEMK